MSRREFVALWVAVLAYTGYAVGVCYAAAALLPIVPAVLVGVPAGLAPVLIIMWFAVVER